MARTLDLFLRRNKAFNKLNNNTHRYNNNLSFKSTDLNDLFYGRYNNQYNDFKFIDIIKFLNSLNSQVHLSICPDGFCFYGNNYSEDLFFQTYLSRGSFWKYNLKKFENLQTSLNLEDIMKKLNNCNRKKDDFTFKITSNNILIRVKNKKIIKEYQTQFKNINDIEDSIFKINNEFLLKCNINDFRDFFYMPTDVYISLSIIKEKNIMLIMKWMYNDIDCRWEIPLNLIYNKFEEFNEVKPIYYYADNLKKIFRIIRSKNSPITECYLQFDKFKSLRIKFNFGRDNKNYFYFILKPFENENY
ncbi:MAG: hypothetical protein ACTSRP_13935 [Candidatus Helarchaeota archaeon]